jgi:hypothetical protein
MKQRTVIVGLTLLSVGLMAVVAWQARLLRVQKAALIQDKVLPVDSAVSFTSGSTDPRPQSGERWPADALPQNNLPVPDTNATAPNNWPKFDWRLVESEDYRTYVKNLRAIGCPEQTVRDIVTADVRQAFAAKRAEVAAQRYGSFKFNEFDDAADAGFARQRREVDEAMNAAVRQLLGAEVGPPSATWEWKVAAMEQQLAFLPEDKHHAALEILRRTGEIDVALPSGISGNRLTSAQAEELQLRLGTFEQRRHELLQVLAPEEYERLDMTISWTANNLRQAMAKFQPTESEFAAIFREWRAHDLTIAGLWATGEPDPGNQSVFSRIREALGEQRYQEYRRTWWK